jgi:hypothetical protein
VVSAEVLRLGEIDGDSLEPHLARLRGRDEPVPVRLLRHAEREASVALRGGITSAV